MRKVSRIVLRYSLSFKQKVVSEIESGKYSVQDVRRIYGINGAETVQKWIKRLGKNHLLNKVVRIEMKDEKDRIKELENRERVLEKALSDAHLKLVAMETLIKCVDDHYHIDVKKNFGDRAAQSFSKNTKVKD